ncbi:MAG: hypothetical protein HY421_01870 [Candidatus Kerfeldbacteria bacterium]|nr:hypothetical protein [Candidatus Kerfeldbacteria bacterium]
MRKAIVRSIGGILTVAIVGVAWPWAVRAATVEGTLVAISGTSLPAVLTVQSGVTTYTVNVSSSTVLVRKFNAPSTLEEFAIGDLLRIEGTVTGTTIDPTTKIKNLSIQRKGSLFWGTILTIDATNKSFTLDPKHRKSLPDQTVLTTASTKFFQGNRAGVFDDLAVGMNVRIVGLWRKSLSRITADRILIKLTEINGTVSAVDCTAKTMTVKRNKGKSSEQTWSVAIKDDTVIRDKHLDPMTCAGIVVNDRVHVRGLKTGTFAINALQIWDRSINKTKHVWKGEISSIDTTTMSFVLDQKKGDDRTVMVTSETILVNKNGTAIAFTDLVVGHEVQVWGTLTGTTVTANLIMDKDLPSS